MPRWSPAWSYGYCERLARRAAGNFYHAFQLLPTQQRLAMCALYAFMRVADDLSDGPEPIEWKRIYLSRWREAFHAALEDDYRHPLYPALRDTIRQFQIPVVHFEEVLDGVNMDLEPFEHRTFADLRRYCYHVASAVGLCCIHVWGFHGEAREPAISAGLALQLTNVLRDLAEDAARGRIYLPTEELERFGCPAEQLRAGPVDEPFRALMRFQVDRTYGYYAEALSLVEMLSPPGRAVFLVMLQTYRGLLDEIVARDFDVFHERIRLPTWRKLLLVACALPIRWGMVAGVGSAR